MGPTPRILSRVSKLCLFMSSLIPERILHLGGLSPCSTLGGGGEMMNTLSLWDTHNRCLSCAHEDRALGWGFTVITISLSP